MHFSSFNKGLLRIRRSQGALRWPPLKSVVVAGVFLEYNEATGAS
jgi:hypothetical protein